MHLDVRLPIGLMFLVIGVILTIYGAASSSEIYQRSLNININLYCGIGLVVFGLVMLGMVWRASKLDRK
jgi:hypothetical protein